MRWCCSHAHIDHIGGIVGEDGKPLFPNAQVYIAQSDFDFWTDEGKLGGPLKDFVVHARKNLLPVSDRLVFFKDGQEFLPGIQAMAAPGHTVGHTIFMVTSNGKSFAFLGDLTHHPILLLEKPRMEFSYDTDPKQAAETRVKLLDMIATNKIPVMSYHFAWPGFGHIAKTGEGFRYYRRGDEHAALTSVFTRSCPGLSRRYRFASGKRVKQEDACGGGGPMADPRVAQRRKIKRAA